MHRIFNFAKSRNMRADSYVDDITVSGKKPKQLNKISSIIMQEGFRVNLEKTKPIQSTNEMEIVGLRVNHQIDIPSSKKNEVLEMIDTLNMYDEDFSFKKLKIENKIRYICTINKGMAKHLNSKYIQKINTILNNNHNL